MGSALQHDLSTAAISEGALLSDVVALNPNARGAARLVAPIAAGLVAPRSWLDKARRGKEQTTPCRRPPQGGSLPRAVPICRLPWRLDGPTRDTASGNALAKAYLAASLAAVNELENLLHAAKSKVIYARRRLRSFHLENLASCFGPAPLPPRAELDDED